MPVVLVTGPNVTHNSLFFSSGMVVQSPLLILSTHARVEKRSKYTGLRYWATENTGCENDGPSKSHGVTMQDIKCKTRIL